jgi:membrane protease YdiL (CAAX protease family)
MKNSQRIIYGLVITVVVFSISILAGKFDLTTDLIPSSFTTHTIMILLSFTVIYFMKNKLTYRFSIPSVKTIIKPVIFGFGTAIVAGVFVAVLMNVAGIDIESHPIADKMNPTQVLIFVFVYASIAEEILFRGFLMNMLKPLESNAIVFLKRKISLPVVICAIAFGAAHLILISTGAGLFFLIRVVFFTTCLGFVAGYYQEKHDNNFYAIIVHMSGNILAVIGSFAMN